MGFFGGSTASDIPDRPGDPSCSRADIRLQLLVFSGRVVRDIGVCGGFVSTESYTPNKEYQEHHCDQHHQGRDSDADQPYIFHKRAHNRFFTLRPDKDFECFPF